MNRSRLLVGLIALTLLRTLPSSAAVYMIDPDHTSIQVSTTHLGIGTVDGRFEKFSGSFEYDPKDAGATRVSVTIEAASINTHQDLRDKHLRSADFLDVAKYPEITFVSTKVTEIDRSSFKILGDLSMHGKVRPVELLARLEGTARDMDGKNRIALTITGDVHRTDFNMLWNRMIGTTTLVGEVIRFSMNVEGVESVSENK
jgi:polyisoprenoid-binding protein YceI